MQGQILVSVALLEMQYAFMPVPHFLALVVSHSTGQSQSSSPGTARLPGQLGPSNEEEEKARNETLRSAPFFLTYGPRELAVKHHCSLEWLVLSLQKVDHVM